MLSAAIVGFLMLPYNLHHLGKEVYGISALAVSFVTMLEFLKLGFGPAMVRFFSEAVVNEDKERLRKISSTAQLLLGTLGLVGAMTILTLSHQFVVFYHIADDVQNSVRQLLTCMAASTFFQFIGTTFSSILMASGRYDYVNVFSMLKHWVLLLCLFVFYNSFGASLTLLGGAMLCAALFHFIAIGAAALWVQGRAVCFSPRYVSFALVPGLFSISILALITHTFCTLSIHVPLLIIGKTLGKEMVAAFAPGLLMASLLLSLLTHINNPMTPLASKDMLKNDGRNLAIWATCFGQILACIGYGIIIMFVVFGQDMLRMWLGEDFVWITGVVTLLVVGTVYSGIQGPNYNLGLGASTIMPNACSAVVMAVLTSIGTFLGTVYWEWGLLEVAACIAIVRMVRNTVFLSWIYSKLLRYQYGIYFYKVYIKPAFGAVVLYAVVYLTQLVLPKTESSLPILLGEFAVYGLIYLGIVWTCGLSRETKVLIGVRAN